MSVYVPGVHRIDGGHVIKAGAVVPGMNGSRDTDTLWVGRFVTVQGPIRHRGSITLARGSVTWGNVAGGLHVVVGSECIIDGDVMADGNVFVQAGAQVRGTIRAGNDVHLLGACKVQNVECGGDVFIAGAPETGTLTPQGRIQTRPW